MLKKVGLGACDAEANDDGVVGFQSEQRNWQGDSTPETGSDDDHHAARHYQHAFGFTMSM
jgi:hypothetical protein